MESLPQMRTDHESPEASGPASGPTTVALQPVTVIDESIREAFLLLDALDRRTLGRLSTPLTCAQFHALAALEHEPGQSLSALAAKLLCAKANASGLVDRLSAMQLVAKQTDPKDGRCIRLSLTGLGTEALARAKQARHEALTAELTALRAPRDLPLGELAVMVQLMVVHLRTASVAGAPLVQATRRPPTERVPHGRPAR